MRRAAALLLALAAALYALPAAGAGPGWQPAAKVPGVFDVGGPRSDGWLVVAGAGRLYLVDPQGAVTPFAQGPGGYADDRGAEAYLAVVPAPQRFPPGPLPPGCPFLSGDVYVLRLHAPIGITKVDVHGQKTNFANVPGVSTLNGIAFDTTGAFGYRLLVTGPVSGGKTQVVAVDCSGAVEVLTRSAPPMEGGMAVAPSSFGSFGGQLIAPDENSGNIYAVGPDGASSLVVGSGLPRGGDIGVESVAFVPPGFSAGGSVFYADRATPGNPHPGTDTLLTLSSSDIIAAGVHEGDLLAVTEGGATAIGVTCASSCTVVPVVSQPSRAHGEGHVVFTVQHPPTSPSPTPSRAPVASSAPPKRSGAQNLAAFVAIVIALAVLGAGVTAVLRARWR